MLGSVFSLTGTLNSLAIFKCGKLGRKVMNLSLADLLSIQMSFPTRVRFGVLTYGRGFKLKFSRPFLVESPKIPSAVANAERSGI